MEFSYEGIGQVVATFAKEEGVEPGMAVVMVDHGTVGKGDANDGFCGVVLSADEECCAVQVGGFAKVHYTGEPVSPGYGDITVDGTGSVILNSGASYQCLIVQVDEDENTAVIKM